MIEYPEAVVLAGQMNQALKGKVIESGSRGNAEHKFAFYTLTAQEYVEILRGKTIGEASAFANMIILKLEPGYALVFGEGGERIILHEDETSLPPKYQFFLRFTDGKLLTVTIQMWGSLRLLRQEEVSVGRNFYGYEQVPPLSEAFTLDYFKGLFAALDPKCKDAIKFFMISKPGVCGLGNGYLQDVLFQARIHPRRRAVDVNPAEQAALYHAVRDILSRAVAAGGRDSELDLFGRPGGFHKTLDSASAGRPCPVCATPIEKIQFLGGASYFCPKCQV